MLTLTAATILLLPAAPAPDPDREAKAKLEAVERELPKLIAAWAKERLPVRPFGTGRKGYAFQDAKVRYFRRVGDREAKATVLLDYGGEAVKRPDVNLLLTIRLRYYGGVWSTAGYEGTWGNAGIGEGSREAALYLMLAIDEAAEK